MSCGGCREEGCAAGAGCAGSACACGCNQALLAPPENPPGQSTIGVRLGDYRDFFAAALRGLSDADRPALQELGTRALDDPTIAWLDAWSIAADVLTFYRERLTNDAYLRTTTDETALRELVALVGFKPRPGVTATAHLAYLLDKAALPVEIPVGAKAQSVPAPGEQMQTFETDESFVARASWSQMSPRTTRPARIPLVDALLRPTLRLSGTTLSVRPGEKVLFVYDDRPGFQVVREVASSKLDIQGGFIELELKPRLLVERAKAEEAISELETLRNRLPPPRDADTDTETLRATIASFFLGGTVSDALAALTPLRTSHLFSIFEKLSKESSALTRRDSRGSTIEDTLSTMRRVPGAQPLSRRQSRDVAAQLGPGGEDRWALLRATTPELTDTLPAVLDKLPASPARSDLGAPAVYLLRTSVGAFGAMSAYPTLPGGAPAERDQLLDDLDRRFVFLEAVVEAARVDSFVVFDRVLNDDPPAKNTESFRRLRIARIGSAQTVGRRGYGISGRSTRLDLVSLDDGRPVNVFEKEEIEGHDTDIRALRSLLYSLQSEAVTLADDAIESVLSGSEIELQLRVDDLQPGQYLIVAGERADILDADGLPVPGVRAAELAMIGGVEQAAREDAPGDTLHTRIALVKPLAYAYKASSTTIYGNVVKASNGETVTETLGSGDASQVGQRFGLKRTPLTFVSAPTVTGVESPEAIRVNGKRYDRVASLLDATATAHAYELDLDASGAASLTFGGARLPTGQQNVRASYRVGIGTPGNVRAEQISLLTSRPLGVTGVVNPLRASGGADRDGPERIRRDGPLAARALAPLSRCVSVDDYAALARRFAGIGHAHAVKLSDGAAQMVHVTVAGIDDIPLDLDGELLGNLRSAFRLYGDPAYPIEIAVRELNVLVLEAKVAIDADASWDLVEPELRRRLMYAFGLDQRRLAQAAHLSEVIAVIQATPGVSWVDVDRFGAVGEADARDEASLLASVKKLALARTVSARPARKNPASSAAGMSEPRFLPAQLAVFLPGAPGLLALNRSHGERRC